MSVQCSISSDTLLNWAETLDDALEQIITGKGDPLALIDDVSAAITKRLTEALEVAND